MTVPGKKSGSLDYHISIVSITSQYAAQQLLQKGDRSFSQWRPGRAAMEKLYSDDCSQYDRQNLVEGQYTSRSIGVLLGNHESFLET